MTVVARNATLEDWESLKLCWGSLKDSRHAWKITGDLPVLRTYFILSLIHNSAFFVPVLVDEDSKYILGFAVIQESVAPSIAGDGQGMLDNKHSFIRALYVRAGTPEDQSRLLEEYMFRWALSRGHEYLMGNCRPDFPDRFAKKYGYEVSHVVVKKSLRGGN